MSTWEPGKPWTHPSVTRKSVSELEALIAEKEADLKDITNYDRSPERDEYEAIVRSLLATYRKALAQRKK